MSFSFSDLKKAQQKFGLNEFDIKTDISIEEQKLLDKTFSVIKRNFNLDVKVSEADSSLLDGKYYLSASFGEVEAGCVCYGGEFDQGMVFPERIFADHKEWKDFPEYIEKKAYPNGGRTDTNPIGLRCSLIKIFDEKPKELKDCEVKLHPSIYQWRLSVLPRLEPEKGKLVYSLRQGLDAEKHIPDRLSLMIINEIDEIKNEDNYYGKMVKSMDVFHQYNFVGFNILIHDIFHGIRRNELMMRP